MRRQDQTDQPTSPDHASVSSTASRRLLPKQRTGRHRRADVVPLVPRQAEAREEPREDPPARRVADEPALRLVEQPGDAVRSAPPSAPPSATTEIPRVARWKSSHAPRVLAVVLLVLAVAGTSGLALRYEQDPGSDQLIALACGIGAVVVLWSLLIASTPQVISLRGSVITVRNSSGTERFDLGDGLQPVDLVGEPGSSSWALLLHRGDRSSLVLRRRDVDAVLLDRVVRHYRVIAARRYAERQARFDR